MLPLTGSDGKSCAGVTCPALPYAGCIGVTPWDACCPKCGTYDIVASSYTIYGICNIWIIYYIYGHHVWDQHDRSNYMILFHLHDSIGGYLTVLMDNKIMQRNIHALGLQFLSSVDIIKRLRYHISSVSKLCMHEWFMWEQGREEKDRKREREKYYHIAIYNLMQLQCNLYGHYSLDGSLSLLVLPTLNSSLDLLVSCSREGIENKFLGEGGMIIMVSSQFL